MKVCIIASLHQITTNAMDDDNVLLVLLAAAVVVAQQLITTANFLFFDEPFCIQGESR
jgi:hypothetical protein